MWWSATPRWPSTAPGSGVRPVPAAIVYGTPPYNLVDVPTGAVQVSPILPGSTALESLPDASQDEAVIAAPPGTAERDYALAQALRVLKPGGRLTAFAPKDKGGSRLKKSLEAFGCEVFEESRKHNRICTVERPQTIVGLDAFVAKGAAEQMGELWSQPGVFSWDRVDPGSALLIANLPPLKGKGADFGAGIGILALTVLASPDVKSLALVDVDRRAIEAARKNVTDPRATIVWEDVRQAGLADLDFVVMNPPFHDGGAEDRALGVAFIETAAKALRKGGTCWLTANRHLPYERPLGAAFSKVELRAEAGGYKIYEARK
ncbi:class I SAM-dependent methyltransferase [Phenylobacterium sp. 20VBR1]|uniref:Class I SAM-dependent methyltransferase n=1 Tax=Phenylobacterium glaciei TaxID=2803784 RepID=A0A941D2V8_9CAUL|nr:class I SAM-dependent methyltransferase [Phenylobacterium glaciei]MBR7620892.1 class I SAM-dependent methyltransferase [Phenylobacterium glaciei]